MQMKRWVAGGTIALGMLLGMSTVVSAAVIGTLGTIPVPGAANDGNTPPSGAFSDDYTFDVATDANLVAKVSILNASGFTINPASVTVSLFDSGGLLTSVAGVTTEIFLNYSGLVPLPETYFLRVVGTAGAGGGNYTVLLSVSEVPLPAAIWLFLSALVGLVSFARIRRGARPA